MSLVAVEHFRPRVVVLPHHRLAGGADSLAHGPARSDQLVHGIVVDAHRRIREAKEVLQLVTCVARLRLQKREPQDEVRGNVALARLVQHVREPHVRVVLDEIVAHRWDLGAVPKFVLGGDALNQRRDRKQQQGNNSNHRCVLITRGKWSKFGSIIP